MDGTVKVLVVYNVVEQIERGEAEDIFAEQKIVLVEQYIEKALQEHGHLTAAALAREAAAW